MSHAPPSGCGKRLKESFTPGEREERRTLEPSLSLHMDLLCSPRQVLLVVVVC